MNEKKPIPIESEEIDLIHLFRRIINFLNINGRSIALCGLGGMLLGFCLFLLISNKYSSRLLLHSTILTNSEQIEIIESWDELLSKGEYQQLSGMLNSDENTLKKVKSLKAKEIYKVDGVAGNPNGFIVEALVKDTAVLASLEQGILFGLNENEFIKSRVTLKKQNITRMIEKVTSEIDKLDSTKKIIENSLRAQGSSNNGFIIDVAGINGQIISFNEKLLSYQESLKFVDAIHVLKSFSKFRNPVEPRLELLLFAGLASGIFAGLLLTFRRNLLDRIRHS
ncbi:hypothetical protein [Parasegetibacter sp. NRK P23]|uniref:hypothetical protein n=1 Tax=Parasegetibacter sp. NRK P23 TaxID=2942999 RepID=UPI002044A909|nr:hypothetical protein [Parasegetibacter sp. NRK P23]MCM5527515.1 hypothetical protein [Parasegetibacter sp. NRK P23]